MGFVGVTNYKVISERLPGKHHIDFYQGESLVDIKIRQLLENGADHVYVNTNDRDVSNQDRVTFIQRDEKYCNNTMHFSHVLREIFHNVPVDDKQDVIYTFTCCPLFNRYQEMYQQYLTTEKNHIAVNSQTHYYLDVNKRPINFTFGMWHPYSQNIDPVYMFPYAGTVCQIGALREVNYMIPMEFEYFPLNQIEAIDIDTPEEFELAQTLYKNVMMI